MNFTIEQLFNDFNAKYLEEVKSNGIDLGLQTVFTPIDKIEKATGFRFADYITADTKTVAVLFNTEFIDYFIKELPQNYINNIKFTFFYDCEFDREQVQDCVFFSGKNPNIEMISIENIKDLDKVMASKKFDIVFSNPPYDRSLHLKILHATNNVINENGKIIFVHPFVWETEMIFEKELSVGITKYILIPAKSFRSLFNLRKEANGCITYIENGNTVKKIENTTTNIFSKIFSKMEKNTITKKSTVNPTSDFTIRVMFTGSSEFGSTCLSTNKFETAIKQNLCGNIRFINLKNENEQKNFFNSLNTSVLNKFMAYKGGKRNILPWMGDYINPRTGLKGYEGEWTNEDFYQFFGITEEEQKYIEETMAQFN